MAATTNRELLKELMNKANYTPQSKLSKTRRKLKISKTKKTKRQKHKLKGYSRCKCVYIYNSRKKSYSYIKQYVLAISNNCTRKGTWFTFTE